MVLNTFAGLHTHTAYRQIDIYTRSKDQRGKSWQEPRGDRNRANFNFGWFRKRSSQTGYSRILGGNGSERIERIDCGSWVGTAANNKVEDLESYGGVLILETKPSKSLHRSDTQLLGSLQILLVVLFIHSLRPLCHQDTSLLPSDFQSIHIL